jgi:hypothetical protein
MRTRLPSFWIKLGLAVALVAAADALLFEVRPGLGLGLFALACVAAVPAVRVSRAAWPTLAVAAVLAALQLDRPTAVGCVLFVIAIGIAALAPRAAADGDVWRWSQRLIGAGLKSLVGPLLDLRRLLKVRARSRPLKVTAVLLASVLPLLGGAVFLWLFASANPVIAEGLASLSVPEPDVGRVVFWGFVALPVWALLRPRGLRRTFAAPGMAGDLDIPGVTTASIAISLVVFNLLFALQNALDVAFLWSGAGLPKGVSFADYAHRGAYTLIATAILAGLFVGVFLRPGSRTAASAPVRVLVTVWVAQNLFLVASTMLRTLDYIEAYSLTRMRIAALLWMALVALGLVLICWRLLARKSSGWLLNANVLAAGFVLLGCSVVDLGAVAASWNVRHAREVGGKGVNLDVCYFGDLKGSGVVSLSELERRLPPGEFRDRVAWKRRVLVARVAKQQAEWRGWRWRDARRLDRVAALTGETPTALAATDLDCDGRKPPLAAASPPPTPPLTPTPNPGT